jgi:thiol-disulfide isomerase/thioredoxin
VAVAAAAAGAVWALRGQSGRPPSGKTDAEPAPDLWGLRLEGPDGGEVILADFRGRPLVLNFWATWCAPCVEEMPMLDQFERDHRSAGWQVLGLAVDSAGPVRDFLARHRVGFPIALAGMQGVAISRSLGNTGGALPYSVIFDRRGEAIGHKLGALTAGELAAWVGRAG